MKTDRSCRRHRSPDSESSKENECETEKQQRKKRKITDNDVADYLINKYRKKAAKLANKIKSRNVSKYVNECNPFNDSKLDESFVWSKKIENDVVEHGFLNTRRPTNMSSSLQPLEKLYSVQEERRKQRERMEDIERMKRRREERAIEKAEREERMAVLARERAGAEFQEWEKKEEEFCFKQTKARAEIRLREGRIKPIDVLSMHLDDPDSVFESLAVKDLEDLREDIKVYLDLDRATPSRILYWEALLVVCDRELAEARKQEALDRARLRGEQPPVELLGEERGLHSSTEADVNNLLEGRSYCGLEVLQTEIESQMRDGTGKVVEFWEALLRRICIYKAKAFLKEYHATMSNKHLQKDNRSLTRPEVDAGCKEKHDHDETEEAEERCRSFSPEILHHDETQEAIDPEEDKAILEKKRMATLEEQQRWIQEVLITKDGDRLFGNNESDKLNLDSLLYWWHDKYRLRKPKYFNHVQTEYRWNKYNQNHYDRDNPPPKFVKGYQFSIFYPDLIGPETPTYTIEKDGHSSETCIIRFHAGPPYEDIAFRVVNGDWERSAKRGFKCTFERGTLHLNFNFKTHSYRR
ncbi:Cactus-binding domain, C-terminal, Cactin, central region [Heracleum sosnowskyi]|uniref:Splicing factor Cactin n=1 Tax=Heracleum sosnowskyi TaxID=360622 RepID=A0AAD8I8L6_9APIA|nr:Cactus-binding domain, C-terminal, Cactin, central region [Heracleum sosnowskyi]